MAQPVEKNIVCPSCGAANESTRDYCQACGRPISFRAVLEPEPKQRPLVRELPAAPQPEPLRPSVTLSHVLFVWLLGGAVLIVTSCVVVGALVAALFETGYLRHHNGTSLLGMFFFSLIGLYYSIVTLLQTTARYALHAQSAATEDAADREAEEQLLEVFAEGLVADDTSRSDNAACRVKSIKQEQFPGGVICPTCGLSNNPLLHFCDYCGGPLTAHAVNDPLDTVLSGGWMVRRAVHEPRSGIVVAGLWLIAVGLLLTLLFGLGAVLPFEYQYSLLTGYVALGVMAGVALLCFMAGAMAVRATGNYFDYVRRRDAGEFEWEEEAEEDPRTNEPTQSSEEIG